LREVVRHRLDPPVSFANLARVRQEIEHLAGSQLLSPLRSGFEQLLATRSEPALELCHELQGIGRQHLLKSAIRGSAQLDIGCGHPGILARS